MSSNTEKSQEISPLPVKSIDVREMTKLLVKHYGLHEGRYNLALEFQIGVGSFGPTTETKLPGAAVCISKIGIAPANEQDGPSTVDAAIVNPKKRQLSKK